MSVLDDLIDMGREKAVSVFDGLADMSWRPWQRASGALDWWMIRTFGKREGHVLIGGQQLPCYRFRGLMYFRDQDRDLWKAP